MNAPPYEPPVPPGSVALVGAGPGDPELLTLKALRCIQAADVLLHDHLVGPRVLALIPETVERIDVGKRHARHTLPQDEISRLLCHHARAGRRVVRLKGGDPLMFGRGGEEMAALYAAGIPFIVVPGITAALGASAAFRLPLTHREYAPRCVFLSGRRRDAAPDADSEEEEDWAFLARPGQTLVFYMGITRLEHIRDALIAHGMSAKTPAALIYKATLPEERLWPCALEDLPERARAENITPPALVIIGQSAAIRHRETGDRARHCHSPERNDEAIQTPNPQREAPVIFSDS
ncbi:MAG: uroporphyrinogen-III C-methyltransferase [Zoogloeaceae bacterium]|jgi:uroporphyrin-III C-methyltransferase|nr:uroporphyrinogen-III C-methyltransferase [Zoogloeaceae bacterium]